MGHLRSSAHPFSLSCRVDYCLNWPQPLPSPSFHFSSADIYWSLSEKFPSGHPFPKVELRRKSSRLVCVCMCAWFINEPKQAFIFLRFSFFFPVTVSVSLACFWLSTSLSFLSTFLQSCFYLPPYFFFFLTPAPSPPSVSLSLSIFPTLHLPPFPSQGSCTAFWTSTPVWCVRIAARLDLTSASTVSSTRKSPPMRPQTRRTLPRILGCPL